MLNQTRRATLREIALSLVVLLVLLYTTMFSGISAPNERSRVYLAVALVDHGSLSIDEPMTQFGWILDTAEHDARYYSDKAPGSSLLGAVVYGAVRLFTQPGDWTIEELLELMRRGLMIPLGVVGFLALRALLRRIGILPPAVDLVSLGWILGSAAFHYSTAYYGHQIVAVALVLSLLCIELAERRIFVRRISACALAALGGALAGVAGLTEYQAGIACAMLALYVLLGPLRRGVWGVLAFALGALPFVLLLGAYNAAAFGGPFELSYHHLASADLNRVHTEGVGGITSPSWSSFHGGILSLHRGLLATSPMFLLAAPGVWALYRYGRPRASLLLGATTLYYVLFISSSNMWVAGWGFGPRLLVPGMGWMALLVAAAAQRWARHAWFEAFVRGSVLAGIAYVQLVHAFFPELPVDVQNPLIDAVKVLYRADIVAPNLTLEMTRVRGTSSLLPLGVAVASIAAFVLARRSRMRGWAARTGVTLLSLSPVGLLVLYAALEGPSGSDFTRKSFLRFVSELSAKER